MPCIAYLTAPVKHDALAATVRLTADPLDGSRKERNVHRGMAATGVSWLCVEGVCALLFQMCGRWHIPDAGPWAKRCFSLLAPPSVAMRPDLFSNTPVAARHQQETRRVGVE